MAGSLAGERRRGDRCLPSSPAHLGLDSGWAVGKNARTGISASQLPPKTKRMGRVRGCLAPDSPAVQRGVAQPQARRCTCAKRASRQPTTTTMTGSDPAIRPIDHACSAATAKTSLARRATS